MRNFMAAVLLAFPFFLCLQQALCSNQEKVKNEISSLVEFQMSLKVSDGNVDSPEVEFTTSSGSVVLDNKIAGKIVEHYRLIPSGLHIDLNNCDLKASVSAEISSDDSILVKAWTYQTKAGTAYAFCNECCQFSISGSGETKLIRPAANVYSFY